jgi:hypothetical protein
MIIYLKFKKKFLAKISRTRKKNFKPEPNQLKTLYPHTSNIPSTWLELDWIETWDSQKEADFEEPHHLNAFRRQFLKTMTRFVTDQYRSGVICEFGVYNGLGSLIMLENSHDTNRMILIDSFEGLSEPSEKDGHFWSKGDMNRSIERVKKSLSIYSERITFYKGFVPEILDVLPQVKLVLAHVDLDLYLPTLQSLEWIHLNSEQHIIIISDDYGFSTCPGATSAVNHFRLKHPEYKILELPMGGAILFKEM